MMTPGLAKQTFIIKRASGIAKNQSENIPRRIPTHQPSLDPILAFSCTGDKVYPLLRSAERGATVLPQATELDLGAMYPARRVSQTENWESITMMTVAAILQWTLWVSFLPQAEPIKHLSQTSSDMMTDMVLIGLLADGQHQTDDVLNQLAD
jgi:hypothetical protein